MAATEQQPRDRIGSIARSRSARLADQAATAALYVTHPDRRLSVREPAAADSQLFNPKQVHDLSHASAGAVLAHATSKPVEIWRPGKLTAAEKAALAVQNKRSSWASYQGDTTDTSRRTSEHEGALLAATGAFRSDRRRAESSPTKPVIQYDAGAEEPLEHLDSANEASRLRHVANANARLFTSTPPVSIETEEQNKKNVMRAAALSMAREMYDITENRDPQKPGTAVYGAQRGVTRMKSQRSTARDPVLQGTVQRALSLQDEAQKRAAEKLAMMHDETAAYQDYYGTGPQAARSSMVRKRRTSDSDASNTDVERSNEIRSQMFSLRTKLNAVDEQRQKDRLMLMEAARRNVDAAIHNMERRVYEETGRAPASMQKEWEEAALERARQEVQDNESQIVVDKVNIGVEQYMDMADVEAVARSRVQPTIDEITEHAEQQRAQEMEARLDQEEKQRRQALERQREADTKAEEKRLRDAEKAERRESKEEKAPFWRKKPKRGEEKETKETPKEEAPAEQAAVPAVQAEEPSEAAQEAKGEAATASGTGTGAAAAAAAGAEPSPVATSPKSESKLKKIFRGWSRRASANEVEEGEETERIPRFTGGAAMAARDDTRGAALSSHPPTSTDLNDMQRISVSDNPERTADEIAQSKEKPESNGRSRLRNSLMRIVSRNSEPRTDGVSKEADSRRGSALEPSSAAQPSAAAEREDLRDSAAEQGLPIPPDMAKRISNTSAARESRFSEDL